MIGMSTESRKVSQKIDVFVFSRANTTGRNINLDAFIENAKGTFWSFRLEKITKIRMTQNIFAVNGQTGKIIQGETTRPHKFSNLKILNQSETQNYNMTMTYQNEHAEDSFLLHRGPQTLPFHCHHPAHEVVEIIELPAFDAKTAKGLQELNDDTPLSYVVDEQLQKLVTKIRWAHLQQRPCGLLWRMSSLY